LNNVDNFFSWTLIEGDKTGGFTIFWPDDGLDTGEILLQRECPVNDNDTVDTLYNGFMYPGKMRLTILLSTTLFNFGLFQRVSAPWQRL